MSNYGMTEIVDADGYEVLLNIDNVGYIRHHLNTDIYRVYIVGNNNPIIINKENYDKVKEVVYG